MDTTHIALPPAQLDAIVNAIKDQPKDILTSGEIALIASAIGVVAAIIPQLIVHFLDKKRETTKLKKELFAEERRIAFLLERTFKELIIYQVSSKAWYRVHCLETGGKIKFYDLVLLNSYNQSLSDEQKVLIVANKIRILMAKYFKTVSHFLLLSNVPNPVTPDLLTEIKQVEIKPPSDFMEIDDLKSLQVAKSEERAALRKEYLAYTRLFDRINEEMKKQL